MSCDRYAFFGNTAWFMQAIAPIPLYSPQHTKVIAKWLLHALSSSRYFLSTHVPHQLSNKTSGLKYDPFKVLAYESCRKCDFDIATSKCVHGNAYGPFAQTDANGGPQGLGNYCSQALYGGTYMSVLGALVWRTNVSTVLQLDIGAFDYHRANFSTDRSVSAQFLVFNPDKQSNVTVAFNRSALGPVSLCDCVRVALLACHLASTESHILSQLQRRRRRSRSLLHDASVCPCKARRLKL